MKRLGIAIIAAMFACAVLSCAVLSFIGYPGAFFWVFGALGLAIAICAAIIIRILAK